MFVLDLLIMLSISCYVSCSAQKLKKVIKGIIKLFGSPSPQADYSGNGSTPEVAATVSAGPVAVLSP